MNFTNVTYAYPSASEPIIKDLTVSFSEGWTGIIGANGIGKTTLAKLAVGELRPQQGFIGVSERDKPLGLYCAQSTAESPEFMSDFFSCADNESGQLSSILGIGSDWGDRWDTLSHGERKRVQLAVLLWKRPDIMIVDEPTNHLDNTSKKMIIRALKGFQGLGIIISHDRELLDLLCGNCLFMEDGGAVMRSGGITAGLAQKETEDKTKEKEYEKNRESYKRLTQSKQKLRQEVSAKEQRNTKKKLDKHDSSGREKVNLARLTGKDGKGSRKVNQLSEKVVRAKEQVDRTIFKKTEIKGFDLTGEIFFGNTLLHLPAGELKLAEQRSLEYPELDIAPKMRIGLLGDNGTGKSTLIRFIVSRLKIPSAKYIYIPQEFSTEEIKNIMRGLQELNNQDMGKLLTIINRLGSAPERIRETSDPSHGELRKIWLGLGLLKVPYLIIMDEPTNHLDHPSIVCLEEALWDFQGALLLVSHDMIFLNKLTRTIWRISNVSADKAKLTESVV